MMVNQKILVHRILGLTILMGFWSAVCAGLVWGLYTPRSSVLGWVAFSAAWAALLFAGVPVSAYAIRSMMKGAPLFDARVASRRARRGS